MRDTYIFIKNVSAFGDYIYSNRLTTSKNKI